MTRHAKFIYYIAIWCICFGQGQGQVDCDFDQGGICEWINVQGSDKLDWTRHTGSTTTTRTGPSADHTKGPTDSTGYYIYLETSGKSTGDNAILKTPVISESSRPTCFQFWYHMHGPAIGKLNVSLETRIGEVGGSKVELLWTLIGRQGDQWHNASVPIPPYSGNFSIMLEAVRETSAYGDIAVDDTSYTMSSCTLSPPEAKPYVNECTKGTHTCDRQASCQKTIDSYTCSCKAGYRGNGHSCTAMPTVFCHSDSFGISMVKNMSSFSTVTLADTSCTATSNATHITLSSSFSECGSTKNETDNYIIISNEVKMLGAASGIITRGNITVIPFLCKYDRSGLETSLDSFQAKIKSVIEAQEGGFGNFTLSINMARSALFDSYHGSYPVTVEVNDRLYLQVSLKANNTDAVLLIEKCYATPTSNKYDATKYTMIENRCPTDSTLQFHSGEIYQKRFSFLAFNFVTLSPTIYLHCEVYLCHKSSKASRCTTGCGINKIADDRPRRKRDIERREIKEPDFTKTFVLDTGEIRKINPKEESNKGASSVPTTTIAMGASIGILGLVLISIFIVKTIKHMKITVLSQMAASNGKHGFDNEAVEMDVSELKFQQ